MTTALLCSTGGHLRELWELRPRLQGLSDVVWIVPRNAQSESLLADERWVPIPYIGSRDWRTAARTVLPARQLLRREGVDRFVTTGGSVVTPYLLAAASLGIPREYIESVARTQGPSLTGRIASRVPGTALFTQNESWARGRWSYAGSVFDRFEGVTRPGPPLPLTRVVVTLGTEPFAFDRAVQALRQVLPPDCAVTWQLGPTTSSEGLSDAHELIPERELLQLMREADLVVAHAGAGSVLASLDAGRCPLLLARRSRFHEAIDDHQASIAAVVQARGLAEVVEVDNLVAADLDRVRSRLVKNRQPPAWGKGYRETVN